MTLMISPSQRPMTTKTSTWSQDSRPRILLLFVSCLELLVPKKWSLQRRRCNVLKLHQLPQVPCNQTKRLWLVAQWPAPSEMLEIHIKSCSSSPGLKFENLLGLRSRLHLCKDFNWLRNAVYLRESYGFNRSKAAYN